MLHEKEYVDLVKTVIKETVEKYAVSDCLDANHVQFNVDEQMFFEMLKLEIRAKTISFGSHRKRKMEEQEKTLEKDIEILYDKMFEGNGENSMPDFMEMIETKQSELENLRAIKMRAAMMRSKVQHYELGEKPTRYFFDLEKRNNIAKTITQLNVKDKIVTNQNKILEAQREFYKELYAPKPSVESDLFLNDECIIKLNEEQCKTCEGQITLDEVKKVLSQMKNNKSPGSDGYTVEFYKFFINEVGVYLLRSFKHAFKCGKLSITQRQGVITCIPKANKSREY